MLLKPSIIRTLAFVGVLSLVSSIGYSQEKYIGEIFLVGYNFCPRGSASADGQLLAIEQNTALFSLYGTTFGGDGRTTFALPDLRGRAPIHVGQGAGLQDYRLGQRGGQESTVLTEAQLPAHTHTATTDVSGLSASLKTVEDVPNSSSTTNAALAEAQIYNNTEAANSSLKEGAVVIEGAATTTVASTGAGQGVSIMQPFLTMRYCVVITGIFPSRN